MSSIDTWKFLAGLGLFLYSLILMEQGSKKLAGRPFKLFLRRSAKSLPKSIIGGTVITGLIQSSSVIILMLMSFVSAGVITFRNAFGLLIGSNLGTTVNSWFIATVGFTFNLQSYSLPIIAITAIIMFFSGKRKGLHNASYFIFSIGILLLGFGFMKVGAEQLVIKFDIAAYADLNLLLILLIGFFITIVIQSSSVTVAIALTALHSHALTFPAAAAIVAGAEVGTTIKILFSSINSSPGAKMLAWGDFTVNLLTAVVAFIFLLPLVHFIQHILAIKDPLIGLVFFQSFINVIAIILVIPVFKPLSSFLERFFSKAKNNNESHFNKDMPPLPELVPGLMQKAAAGILTRVLDFHNRIFEEGRGDGQNKFSQTIHSFTRIHGTTTNEYSKIKETEGEYLQYYGGINEVDLSKEEYSSANRFIDSMRQSIHAAKSVHDIRRDLKIIRNSADNYLFQQSEYIRNDWESFYSSYSKVFDIKTDDDIKNNLVQLKQLSFNQYAFHERDVKLALHKQNIQQLDGSTLLNVYQEILSSKKALLRALALLRLESYESPQTEFTI